MASLRKTMVKIPGIHISVGHHWEEHGELF
jgi:hypothetical protein